MEYFGGRFYRQNEAKREDMNKIERLEYEAILHLNEREAHFKVLNSASSCAKE